MPAGQKDPVNCQILKNEVFRVVKTHKKLCIYADLWDENQEIIMLFLLMC